MVSIARAVGVLFWAGSYRVVLGASVPSTCCS